MTRRSRAYDARAIREPLGRKGIPTTMFYVRVLKRGGRAVESPADG